MRFEPPTSAANANLKASSRAQPAGVRHPLTSLLPFHLRSDLLRPFSGNGTSEEPTTQVRQDGSMNSHEKRARSTALRRFITANPPRPVHKTPPPFSHKFRNLRVGFPHLAYYFFSSLMPNVRSPGLGRRHGSAVRQSTQTPPQVLNILSHHEVFHRPPYDSTRFPIRPTSGSEGERCVSLSLIGGCAVPSVSFADLPRFLAFSSG